MKQQRNIILLVAYYKGTENKARSVDKEEQKPLKSTKHRGSLGCDSENILFLIWLIEVSLIF